MSISFVVDTLCDVPLTFISRYNITVMPLKVHFGEESFLDGIDITSQEFFHKLANAKELPTTSQITPTDFLKVFEKELEKGNEILAILGSSHLSGTYYSALLAKEELKSDSINIIDSKAISLGAGMLVVKAARLAVEGKTAKEIVNDIEESKKRMKHFIVIGNLKYIYKGGRLSFSATILGSALNIKPILTVVDGKLETIEKTRGMKKAISNVLDIITKNGYDLNKKIIGINHSVCPDYLEYMEEKLKEKYDIKEIIRGDVGSVIGTHAGPNCVALYFEE